MLYIDGLVHERRNSIAIALELRLSCTNPSLANQTKKSLDHSSSITLGRCRTWQVFPWWDVNTLFIAQENHNKSLIFCMKKLNYDGVFALYILWAVNALFIVWDDIDKGEFCLEKLLSFVEFPLNVLCTVKIYFIAWENIWDFFLFINLFIFIHLFILFYFFTFFFFFFGGGGGGGVIEHFHWMFCSVFFFNHLFTHCGLVRSFDDRDLGQHWLT